MSATAARIYAYGIVPLPDGGGATDLPAVNGISGGPVRALRRGELAALVSELPDDEATLDDVLQDVERVKQMVLAHHHVLQAVVDRCTVLPLRFGTVFGDDAGVAAALEAHRQGLCEALARVAGTHEWGLKLFCDRGVLSRHLETESPTIGATRAQMATTSQGHAFFLGRQLEKALAEEAEHIINCCVADGRLSLLAAAQAEAVLKPQPAVLHGHAGEMVWNGAFLVAKTNEQRFFDSLDALKRRYGASGFDFECTGPWPPASFAECRLE